jgi:glucose/arabinose dehydrogenase
VGRKKTEVMELEEELLEEEPEPGRRCRCGKLLMLLALAGAGAAALQKSKAKGELLPPGSGTVTLRDAEPGPLAFMMSEMVKAVIQDPRKKALADKMNVSVAIQDLDHPEMAATMIFRASDVEVANGVIDGVDIFIGTELALLLSLSGAGKGKQMLKWLQSEDGQKVLKAVRTGRFKVRGALKNARQMAMFQKFLTPAG